MLVILAAGGSVVCLAGCGGGPQQSGASFALQANRVCAGMNSGTALPDVKRVDGSLRRIRAGLVGLARLSPPASERHAFRDMLTQMRRVYLFSRTHESALIRMQRGWRAADSEKSLSSALKRYAQIFRPIKQDLEKAGTDALALHLTGCVTTSFTYSQHAVPNP